MKRQIFKPYEQNQVMFVPPLIVEELIPETHNIRIVNRIIGEIDKEVLEKQFNLIAWGFAVICQLTHPHSLFTRFLSIESQVCL